MQYASTRSVLLAVAFAALAGYVDALAFLGLGGFFASSMGGVATRFGAALGAGVPVDAIVAGAIALGFVAGAMLSAVLLRALAPTGRAAAMAAVALILVGAAAAATFQPGALALTLLAMAMGAQAAALAEDEALSMGLVHLAGTLVRLGQRLAGALMGDADQWSWLRYLALWLGFVLGVVVGAAALGALGGYALWIAPVAAAALAAGLAMVDGVGRRARVEDAGVVDMAPARAPK